jgi:nitroreductase
LEGADMDLLKVIRERRSIRKFRPDEVSNKIIKEILEDAFWSPSWGNTQPWELYILTGEILKKLKDLNRELFLNGEKQKPDLTMPEAFGETGRICHLGELRFSEFHGKCP